MDGICPISTRVATGTYVKVVGNVQFAQAVVYILVDLVEEVTVTAIDDEGRLSAQEGIKGIVDGVVLPVLRIFGGRTQLRLHLPVVGEGADVQTSAGAACGSECLGMTQGVPHGSVAAHAESGYGTTLTAGISGVVGIDVCREFFRDERFELYFGMQRTVPIPAAVAVGTDDEQVVVIRHLLQVGDARPTPFVAAISVQQIECGHLAVSIRYEDQHADVPLHFFTKHFQCVYLGSLDGCAQSQE